MSNKNQRKLNSKKGNPKYHEESKCTKTPQFKGKNYNDTSWYTKNSQLVKDTCNVPFNVVNNEPLRLNGSDYSDGIPMMLTFGHDWLIGLADTMTVAARSIWADVRKVNSGATNYEGSDIIQIITAAADVFINCVWLGAFFGISSYFNAKNKAQPKIIFKSAGIDYDDFVQNMADYRARFNKLMLRARTIIIPKKYPWIEAAMALFGNLFKDEDTDTGKEQLYWINKAAFYILSHTNDGYSVKPVTIQDYQSWKGVNFTAPFGTTPNGGYTTPAADLVYGNAAVNAVISGCNSKAMLDVKYSFFLDILEMQIDAIVTDEDANIIQGDLNKAFGDQPAYTTGQIDENYEIRPKYSEEFNWYLHNAIIYNTPMEAFGTGLNNTTKKGTFTANVCASQASASASWVGYYKEIKQLPGKNAFDINIKYSQAETQLSQLWAKDTSVLIDSNKVSPGPEDVVWYTRPINLFTGDKDTQVISNGTLMNMYIWYVAKTPNTVYNTEFYITGEFVPSFYDDLLAPSSSIKLFYLTAFAWYPIMYYGYNSGTAASSRPRVWGQLNNPTKLDRDTLRRINDIVLMSLFDIPNR